MNTVIEIYYWFRIFISPVLASAIMAAIIYFTNSHNYGISIAVLVVGTIIGIVWAERIRKKYGCSAYFGKLLATPEFNPNEAADIDAVAAKEPEDR
jgi:hypothetical protein